MNNPAYMDKYIEPGFILWLEENYPFYYECIVNKEYSKIPGHMHTEYLEELGLNAQNPLYKFGVEF